VNIIKMRYNPGLLKLYQFFIF